MVSVCVPELAHPSFVPIEGWHFGIWSHIWETRSRAQSGCLGSYVDPPLKLSNYRHLWSQRLGDQAWPQHLLAVGPRQYSQVIWAGSSADTDSAWHWAWCLVGAQKVAVHFPSTHWQILILSHNIHLLGVLISSFQVSLPTNRKCFCLILGNTHPNTNTPSNIREFLF